MALQVWLPLNGDLKNNGLLDVTITNHGAIVDNNGKIGKCYTFDNNTSYIALQHINLYSILNGAAQPFSVCFWVYQADTSRAIIFGDYSVSGGNNFNIELTTGHDLRWYWGTPDINISAMNVGLETWAHVAFTYDGTQLLGYINGEKKYEGAYTLSAKGRTTGEYYLGRDGRTGTTTLNGKLNDFRIYDHALSPKEVKEISKGLVVHYKLNDIIYGIVDSSGYGYNGTVNGSLTSSTNTPRYNASSYMAKTTTITHARPVFGGIDQEWTCSMWVKLDNISQTNQQLNNFNEGNRIIHSADGYPLLYLNSGTNDYYNYGNLAVSANVWTHITFVFKNSNATKLIYINGVNHTNTSGPNKTSTPSGILDIITIGSNLAGYISDYRIYATALSADDILELYKTSTLIDNQQNIYAYEFIEDDDALISPTGILTSTTFTEDEKVQVFGDGQIKANNLYEL